LKLDHLNAIGKYIEYWKRFTGPSPLHSRARSIIGPEASQPYGPTAVRNRPDSPAKFPSCKRAAPGAKLTVPPKHATTGPLPPMGCRPCPDFAPPMCCMTLSPAMASRRSQTFFHHRDPRPSHSALPISTPLSCATPVIATAAPRHRAIEDHHM
jgi:hypothetical protein